MKISILTPSFNSVAFIERAINSVLVQDYTNWEHIVIDGGSTDGTIGVLEKYDHLIWLSEEDRGQSDAMNKAFARATGDIILYLNADDKLHAGLFSALASEFADHPESDMLVGDLTVVSPRGTKIMRPSVSLVSILRFQSFTFPLNPVCYAYRASLQKRIGPFPLENHRAMDYWFLLRAYLLGNVRKHHFNCGTFYLDGNNKSSDKEKALQGLKQVQREFLRANRFRLPVMNFIARSVLRSGVRVLKRVK